jgi:hypothetical protein
MTASRLTVFVMLCALVDVAGASGDVRVATIARDGRVYVSCHLSDDLIVQLDGAIQAGLAATITYDVDLRRPVGIWFDRTIAAATVAISVQHDTLTGRYQLTRTIDGRVDDSRVLDNRAGVHAFITRFDRLPLFGTADLEANVEYDVRVRVRTRPRLSWFLWPWDRGLATGSARFTFIP